MNELMIKVGIELLGQLKIRSLDAYTVVGWDWTGLDGMVNPSWVRLSLVLLQKRYNQDNTFMCRLDQHFIYT